MLNETEVQKYLLHLCTIDAPEILNVPETLIQKFLTAPLNSSKSSSLL
jgi:hypothetical protein